MPHIHVEYSGEEAVVLLDDTVIEGSIPKNKMKLLLAWMEIHHDELEANWRLLSAGENSSIASIRFNRGTAVAAKIMSVETRNDLKLLLSYSTGESKIFDVVPYATGGWFGELKDPVYFAKVRLLPDGSGIEWPDGQDIAPRELYELGVEV